MAKKTKADTLKEEIDGMVGELITEIESLRDSCDDLLDTKYDEYAMEIQRICSIAFDDLRELDY